MKITILEPYYGGSHRSFVDTFMRLTRHECTLSTLPARKWKWRMRGASLWYTQDRCRHLWESRENTDLIFCSDMLSVADLRALLPPTWRNIPIVCYFHENQFTYPLSADDERDYQYGVTNVTSCMASDAVWFNSHFHREAFLEAIGDFLRLMPDHVPDKIGDLIAARSSVHYPPVQLSTRERSSDGGVPIILWCHRWEYDKNPEPFFHALLRLKSENVPFQLVLTGEQFRTAPAAFQEASRALDDRILHAGYLESHEAYVDWLHRCDLVVSSAIQENFGIAVVEAMSAGCIPVLPNRLAYPELIPPDLHATCLFDGDDKLYRSLSTALPRRPDDTDTIRSALRRHTASAFDAATLVSQMDDALSALCP
ncbi:MAG: tRNA-queuosine alpha-mannosyltransferase domain-containing protein [Planctomycetota bacterium]|jgi:glycosyltransferase involved in cell wall biosynthesis